MSNEFCSSDGELLRCYSQLSNDECHQRVKQITVNCEAAYSNAIPDHLGKSDTQVWGGAIGDCAKEGVLQLIQTQSLVPVSEACRQTVLDM